MVRVSTEESRVAARFAFIVRAESTQRAVSIVAKRYPVGEDLPAPIEADRLRAEEEYQRGQAEVVRGALVELERFFVAGLAEAIREAGQ